MERCFNEKIDRKMGSIVDAVEDRIQNAILTAIDNIITPRIELAVRSITASYGRDATSVTANPERRDCIGVTALFENVSQSNNTFCELSAIDETRRNFPGEASDLSVSGADFDRQSRTHHKGQRI